MARFKRWLDAIEEVILQSDHPLHSTEIAAIALRDGLVRNNSQWPENTVQAAVWRHINQGDNEKGFVMIGEGRVHRRYWLKRKGKPK
ncbi:MAG: HTH domain-containing protein [Planctomycetaceae bacterium]